MKISLKKYIILVILTFIKLIYITTKIIIDQIIKLIYLSTKNYKLQINKTNMANI